MKIQHLIPLLFLAACVTVFGTAAQTAPTSPAGTTITISSTSDYISADGNQLFDDGPFFRAAHSPIPSVPIKKITTTPTNGPTTVTLHARTRDGKLPVDESYIHLFRTDANHSPDLTLGTLSFAGKHGDWTVTNVAPGGYEVSLRNTNYVFEERYFQSLGVKAGTNYTIEFELWDGATFKGRVLDDATGKPIAGAFVRGETETQHHYPSTDAEGRYEMSHVTGGLEVAASATDYVKQVVKLDAAGEDSTVSVPDIRLQRGGWISGRVERPAGMESNTRAYVSLEIKGNFSTNSVIVGAYGGEDGIFRTGPLPPGICNLHAELQERGSILQATGYVSNIVVIAGQDTTNIFIPTQLTIQTNSPGGITFPHRLGTVHYSNGKPAVGVHISFYFEGDRALDNNYHEAVTDNDGHYDAFPQEKTYQDSWGPKILTNIIIARDLEKNLAAIQPFSAVNTNDVDLILHPAIILSGCVKNADGAPVAGAEIALLWFDWASVSHVIFPLIKANEQGQFSTPALPQGIGYSVYGIKAEGYGSSIYGLRKATLDAKDTQTNHYEFPTFVLKRD